MTAPPNGPWPHLNQRAVKRSVTIAGHRTSVTLEQPFWDALHAAATKQNRSLSALIAQIDAARSTNNLSSALRLYVLHDLKTAAIP